jgi:formylglycine-generating enzyme required for sulfatase activity
MSFARDDSVARGGRTIAAVGCFGGTVAIVLAAATAADTAADAQVAAPAASIRCPWGMAAVAGGTYRINHGGQLTDAPMRDFCLDRTEVTVAAYDACVRAGACTRAKDRNWLVIGDAQRASIRCNDGHADRQNHPINCVDWDQATAYCRAQGKRLPAEEEWGWAAQGGAQARRHPWGDAEPVNQLCWVGPRGLLTWSNGDAGVPAVWTCPVGSFPAGDAPGGIHDLAGDVAEWTSGDFGNYQHVVRGSSAVTGDPYPGEWSPTAPEYRIEYIGFRCAWGPR